MNKNLIFSVLCSFLCSWIFMLPAFASNSTDITNDIKIVCSGIDVNRITDNNIATHSGGENVIIEIYSERPLEGVYIKYNTIPSQGKLNGVLDIAMYGFLHEYVSLDCAYSATLTYTNTDICDIQVFSQGILPDYVQKWNVGKPETDLLLCATHSDDDQLFFAGLLPYYAVEKGVNVRVAYFINHYDTYNRTHELLDGLWHCGVNNYPDISPFPDGYSENIQEAENFLKYNGFDYDDIITFQKNLINKYKPLTVVLHDINGEYGHGAHMLNTKAFIDAFENDEVDSFKPEKVYIHLYPENKITLPIDEQCEALQGKTPFQVSQQAFMYHKSQHWTWFYSWIYGKNNNITKASQITRYSPSEYGLYFTRVGQDIDKNDILENILTYAQREEINIKDAKENPLIKENLAENEITMQIGKVKPENQHKHKYFKFINDAICLSIAVTVLLLIFFAIYIKFKKKR